MISASRKSISEWKNSKVTEGCERPEPSNKNKGVLNTFGPSSCLLPMTGASTFSSGQSSLSSQKLSVGSKCAIVED